jgi:hypothetical protein
MVAATSVSSSQQHQQPRREGGVGAFRLLIDQNLLHTDDGDDTIVENSILVSRGTPVIHSGHTKGSY